MSVMKWVGTITILALQVVHRNEIFSYIFYTSIFCNYKTKFGKMTVFISKNQIICHSYPKVSDGLRQRYHIYANRLTTSSAKFDLVVSRFMGPFNKSFIELTNSQNYLSNNVATG